MEVTREDVTSVVTGTAPVSIFEFLDAVGARECGPAIELLGDLLGSGEDIMSVHAMTLRHIRTLLSVRALSDRDVGIPQIQRELGMAEWQVQRAIRQARRYEPAELSHALRDAAEMEARMKSGRGEPRLLFERWLVDLCREP
jgi:DNA polymerase-3 subunit delta